MSLLAAPHQELLLLLATGSCTAPLQSFLGSTLGEANLRRVARLLDSTANGLHTGQENGGEGVEPSSCLAQHCLLLAMACQVLAEQQLSC
jgi:hypothetical protein